MFIEPLQDTAFQRRMAQGHEMRLGHKLDAVQVSEDGILWPTIRKCCGEPIPETVQTWADQTPQPDTKD